MKGNPIISKELKRSSEYLSIGQRKHSNELKHIKYIFMLLLINKLVTLQ